MSERVRPPSPAEKERLAEAFDSDGKLTPEMAQAFDVIVARLKKRRRIYLWGYGGSVLSVLVGAPLGLYWMAQAPERARGWILLVPLLIAALLLYFCGKMARRS
jgi:hypothetical protein